MKKTEEAASSSDHQDTSPRKGWWKHLSGLYSHHRKVTLASGVFFGIILLIFVSQPLIGSSQTEQKSDLLQAQSIVLREINQLPSPDGIVIGQQNADARAIIERTTSTSSNIKTTQADLSLPHYSRLTAWLTPSISSSDIKLLKTDIDNLQKTTTSTLVPYQQSLEALLLFFEYSPQIDTLEYSSGSGDTTQRMDRLSGGLSEAKTSLESIDHRRTNELTAIIASAQELQTSLEATGDVDSFTEEFSALQTQAKDLLTQWHSELQSDLRTHINNLNRTIQHTL